MLLTATRRIAAPIDRVWSLQLDHPRWPERLPNFSRVQRDATPFGLGASATITQPGLGAVVWTVTRFEESPTRRSFAWSGASGGAVWEGNHQVETLPDGTTQLTLGLAASGPLITLFGWLLKGRMQQAIEDEAAAFERWALDGG